MKKGFTLIELLAVIVILAIIALIATPIVLNIINNSKDESNERSVELYAESLKQAMARYQMNNNESISGTFAVVEGTEGKQLKQGDTILNIDYDGNVVCNVIEIYEDGNIYLSGCKTNNENKEYTYGIDKTNNENYETYIDGQIVYFDVITGKGCTNYHEDNSIAEYNGIYEGDNSRKSTNNQNSCLKFYAFLDDGGDSINLLLDHNTTTTTIWTNMSTFTVEGGPIDLLINLYNDTKEWNITKILDDYTLDQTGQTIKVSYEIEYSKTPETIDGAETAYKARVIEAQEIAKITKADAIIGFDEKTSNTTYYLDGEKGTDSTWQTQVVGSDREIKESTYYWLFDRTSNCTSYGCKVDDSTVPGYWTSTSSAGSAFTSWRINYDGSLDSNSMKFAMAANFGVRPVIEVYKSSLK